MKIYARRGQAALEFMMTYGWAILVVLAAIGALSYFGILNPSRFTPDTCMGTSGVSCAGKPIVTNTSIWFTMVNGMGYTLTPVGHNYSAILSQANCGIPVYCPIGDTNCVAHGTNLSSIQDGGSAIVVISNCQFNYTSVVKGDIKIFYINPSSRLTENTIISVTGKTSQS